jgi:hypothetical protein
VTKALTDYEDVIFVDFEFVAGHGERPDVVCLAWHELSSGQTFRLWRDELGSTPPYRTNRKVLFVCFVGNAELGCHLALEWSLPVNVLDLNPEFRCGVNGRTVPEGKGLLGAMAYFGLDAIDSKRKDDLRKRIMQGWPFSDTERADILKYCASDVDAMVRLWPKLLPQIDLPIALYRGAFVTALARMEHAGVPIDREIFDRLADKNAWRAVRDAMVPEIDAQYGVYVRDTGGEWHFSMDRFAAYLARERIAWPVTETGKLSTKEKTFQDMAKGHPQFESLRQLRHAREKMRKVKLPVGGDGRNRTVLWPFKSKTGRTQPKASESIFSPAVWLRSLIRPESGRALAYVDFSSMEFMVAAALSGDRMMLEFYNSGDPYLSFAKRVGKAPADATKKTHGQLRDRYKAGLLAIQYGIGPETLAGRLGVSTFEAHEMIAQHRELFVGYWRWAEDWLAAALDKGKMWTPLGWQCATGITEFNARSITNWPVQSAGAEILRIACIWADRHKLGLRAPVHDALLIEATEEQIDAAVALLRELMRRASKIVLNPSQEGMHELRTDCTMVHYPYRYTDGRGVEIWENVLRLLAKQQPHQQAMAVGE